MLHRLSLLVVVLLLGLSAASSQPSPTCSPPPTPGYESSTVLMDTTMRLTPGDRVIARSASRDRCGGEAVVNQAGGAALSVWLDDPTTPADEGLADGEPFGLEVVSDSSVWTLDTGWAALPQGVYLARHVVPLNARSDSLEALIAEIEARVDELLAGYAAETQRADSLAVAVATAEQAGYVAGYDAGQAEASSSLADRLRALLRRLFGRP